LNSLLLLRFQNLLVCSPFGRFDLLRIDIWSWCLLHFDRDSTCARSCSSCVIFKYRNEHFSLSFLWFYKFAELYSFVFLYFQLFFYIWTYLISYKTQYFLLKYLFIESAILFCIGYHLLFTQSWADFWNRRSSMCWRKMCRIGEKTSINLELQFERIARTLWSNRKKRKKRDRAKSSEDIKQITNRRFHSPWTFQTFELFIDFKTNTFWFKTNTNKF
jgi:hypothetical protein